MRQPILLRRLFTVSKYLVGKGFTFTHRPVYGYA